MIVKTADDPVNVVLTVGQVSDLIDVLDSAEYVFAYYGRTVTSDGMVDQHYSELSGKAARLLIILENVWRKEVDR